MASPLSFLRGLQPSSLDHSLGDTLAFALTSQTQITTLLDCLPDSPRPALYDADPARPPLDHASLRSFVQHFALPSSSSPSNQKRLGPNTRVLLLLPTGPLNALALLAISAYHTCAPVNAACTPAELREDAVRLGARVLVTTLEDARRLEVGGLEGVEVVVVRGREGGMAGVFDMCLYEDGEAKASDASSRPPIQTTQLHSLTDQSLILHTSGTSGKKKVVPYSLLSLIVGTCAVVESWDLREEDVNLNMMPLFHVGGIVRNLLAPVFSGGSAIMCAGFDAMAFWQLARELGVTWYYAAPTIHHAILSAQPSPSSGTEDLRIRMIANAAGGLLPSLAVSLRETFRGAVVLPSYGMTECMPIASPPITYALERPGCSGVACGPHLSIRSPGDIEVELGAGRTGAICVRGWPVFEGYEVEEKERRLERGCFSKEGWFDSGDVGHLDEDGYLFITGRSKEIINKGGEVVSPFEVEEAVVSAGRGWVETALAFGIEHDVLQETIGVVVVPVSGRPRIGLAQLLDLLRDHLHPSKWPFALVYMDDVPKNAAGKPLRIKLATRLGIPQLSDSVPPLERHYEVLPVDLPSKQAPLSQPIPCRRVGIDLGEIERALRNVYGVSDVALRVKGDTDDLPEAFVAAHEVDASDVGKALERVLPGYAVPSSIHVLPNMHVLPRLPSGGLPDFAAIENVAALAHAAAMSEHALLVRDIMGNLLLNADTKSMRPDSDFFLLGGNSLLLGKLAYQIRRRTGVAVGVASLFANSTIGGIAGLIEREEDLKRGSNGVLGEGNLKEGPLDGTTPGNSAMQSEVSLNLGYDYDEDVAASQDKTRGQTHPVSMIVQALPMVFFYPLKTALTWTALLLVLSALSSYIDGSFWERISALLCAIVVARLATRIIAPVTAIVFKWVVIGKYRPGTYRMWSNYHLRWWIVNQSLRIAGRGVFAVHPALERLYFRLLGARIGRNVRIDKGARLGEYDLLTLRDGCRVDGGALVRGFAVEREGYFRLDHVIVGEKAVVNTYTQLAPGAVVPDGSVYGPHASSRDSPSSRSYAAFNRTLLDEPNFVLKLFVAWPVMFVVYFVSYLPWFAALYLMVDQVSITVAQLNTLESVVYWFSSPQRVAFHALSRVLRAVATPVLQLILGIFVKRLLGLNTECATADMSQLVLLRRYINGTLLSQHALKQAFSILGTHYEAVSVVYRCMGAKIGKRVYWPGSGIYCLDPELLEIGNDVVFGSRSEVFTTDRIGSARVTVADGAMIADRVVLLPGCKIGRRTVMGSGAIGMRDSEYRNGSTWLGADCLDEGTLAEKFDDPDTTTPFGRAFYKREADYFVFPYPMILLINLIVATLSAGYWSISAVAAAQILRQWHLHARQLHIYHPVWYRPAVLYGLIAISFIIVLNLQAIIILLWAIATKWIVIGRRREGKCAWDRSSYCQRWQLHLTLSRFLYKGYGNGGVLAPLTGTVYIVWYFRALGARIGKNCSIYAGGRAGLMTEPDLVHLGDNVNLDECSVVAHINSRGNFALNSLKIGNGCALRSGSRLLSGASMEDSSMLCEHTLLTSGDVADSDTVYSGWPAKPVDGNWEPSYKDEPSGFICPMCRAFPKDMTSTSCGHIFCKSCIRDVLSTHEQCPVCMARLHSRDLTRIYPSFAL
ncbi:peroxisomal-coenzyme A synthetase [Favolaschia claudopus]|uniref:Peroxisomal-coenzyme A synthetase n=1 Tax=Favolaschia claudopus TaxID=2862362 RepID=A0AAW0BXQ8_9AGAR